MRPTTTSTTTSPPPDRQSIDNGSIVIVDLDEVHEENTAHWMFARGRGFLVCTPHLLHEEHWIHGKIRRLSTEMIGLAPVGAPQHAHFSGIWVAAALTLCDAVRLRVGDDTVDIGKEAVFHGGTIFVPAGENSGFVVRQISNFIDEHDDFREYEQETDMDCLADLIRRLRSVDPQDTLASLLQPLHLEKYPVLHDKTFRVCVDGKSEAPLIELIE